MSPSRLDSTFPFEISSRRCILFLLLTIPLLFGATHPFVQGLYTFYLLLGSGVWLVFGRSRSKLQKRGGQNQNEELDKTSQRRRLKISIQFWPVWLLFFYIAITTLPLPLGLLGWVSPFRAQQLIAVNTLADTAITCAPLSYSGLLTLKQGVYYLALFLYFLSARTILRRNQRFALQVVTIMVAIGCFEAVYGLLQVMNHSLGVLWLPSSLGAKGVARGTIIYRNQYATFLNMCWPLAVAIAALKIKKHPPSLFLFGAGLMMLAVLFSLSRGGTIALCCISIMIGLTMPFSKRKKLATVFLCLLFLAFYGALLGGYDDLISRFVNLQSSALQRFTVWRMSLMMLFDHSLTGIGLESYSKLSPLYLKNFSGNLLWDRAHNEYVELAIELGWPAMLLFTSYLFSRLAIYGRRILRSKDAILGIAAFAGICSFFIHGTTDFGWQLPANSVYCVTLMALVAAQLDRQRKKYT
ncbi:O-antigen ligase family protein [bacterium]|nr:O-antigen ligase family protein [bacterium]